MICNGKIPDYNSGRKFYGRLNGKAHLGNHR